MKKYFSFFRLRLTMGLQYRAAALGGLVTQFFWGFMLIAAFRAFYNSNPSAFPMEFKNLIAYIWLQQAFLAIFTTWRFDNTLFQQITEGGIAYELVRPIRLYEMWYVKNLATRLSEVALRFWPILTVAFLLPERFRLPLPKSPLHLLLFLVTLLLGLLLTISFLMLIYGLTFYTMSPQGLRHLFSSLVEFLSGQVLPLPFFPDKVRRILELLPFAGMQNVPLRIYSGDLSGAAMVQAILLQVFWLLLFIGIGKLIFSDVQKKTVVQGG